MDRSNGIKTSDNIYITRKETQRRNRLNSIKHELESGNMSSFNQMFAIISETKISSELGLSFYTFRKNWQSPGRFSIDDMMRMAALFGVTYDTIHKFLIDIIKTTSKSRIFK